MKFPTAFQHRSAAFFFAALSITMLELFSAGASCGVGSRAGAADLVRPCGPDSLTGPLRKLIPQGVGGADFRPICVRHDACYDTYGANKSQCDQRYLRKMKCACRNSRHPIRCRLTARIMYAFTHRGGQKSFDDAQRIARIKLFGR